MPLCLITLLHLESPPDQITFGSELRRVLGLFPLAAPSGPSLSRSPPLLTPSPLSLFLSSSVHQSIHLSKSPTICPSTYPSIHASFPRSALPPHFLALFHSTFVYLQSPFSYIPFLPSYIPLFLSFLSLSLSLMRLRRRKRRKKKRSRCKR